MAQRDYYDILGVPRDADKKTLKDAYHRLAMKWHPDRNKAPDAEDRFKEIAKAYAVLSDPKKRARYDASGEEGVAHFTSDDLFRDVDLGSIFGDFGFGFGPGGDSVFDRFFGGRRRAAGGARDERRRPWRQRPGTDGPAHRQGAVHRPARHRGRARWRGASGIWRRRDVDIVVAIPGGRYRPAVSGCELG